MAIFGRRFPLKPTIKRIPLSSLKAAWFFWANNEALLGMFKNVASQKITLLAIDTSTGAPKTGDSANIAVYLKKDGGSVTQLTDTSATEDDATNAPGQYTFDVSQTESNADWLEFTGKSSTANIRIVPKTVYTVPPYFTTQSIGSTGVVAANLTQIDGLATNGNNATLNLKKLNIVNTSDYALNIIATAYDAARIHSSIANGLEISSDGVGASALYCYSSDSTGYGINALSGYVGIYSSGTTYGAQITGHEAGLFIEGTVNNGVYIKAASGQYAVQLYNYASSIGEWYGRFSSDSIDKIATTAPTGVASNFREMMVQLWRRFFKKSTLTATQLKTYADDGSTVVTTQTVADDGSTQTQGAGS